MSAMNERSILIVENGNCRNAFNDEYPAPKSSIAS